MQPGLPRIFLLSISETQVQESVLDDSWMSRLSDGDGEGLSLCVCVLRLALSSYQKAQVFHGYSAFIKPPVPLR